MHHRKKLSTLPDHANTLEEIAETNGESFYRGALAQKIEDASIEGGGFLRKTDLEKHKTLWVEPLSISVGDANFYELPPNGQGIAALIAMKIVEATKIDLSDCDKPRVLHVQIEAMMRNHALTGGCFVISASRVLLMQQNQRRSNILMAWRFPPARMTSR